MTTLQKSIPLYQGIGLLVSTLLGSGIFVVPAIAATIAGGNSLISWVLMVLFVIPIALLFSHLGALYPPCWRNRLYC